MRRLSRLLLSICVFFGDVDVISANYNSGLSCSTPNLDQEVSIIWRYVGTLGCPVCKFGENCAGQCHCKNAFNCNQQTGTCEPEGCEADFSGYNCQECENCSRTCYCKDRTKCYIEGETCECEVGYRGHNCNQTCRIGTFGEGCSQTCHCKNNHNCDLRKGTCGPEGCEIGYKGHNCQQYCEIGTFGEGCSQICHCKDNSNCDSEKGTCGPQGCEIGYKGHNCQQSCEIGTFGEGCSQRCHCKNSSNCDSEKGTCGPQGCEIGYKGHNCQQSCDIGTFGEGCSQRCHCKNSSNCDSEKGTCGPQGCEIGYKGHNCQQSCSNGTFGEGCFQTCHCKNNDNCNSKEGTCGPEGCKIGYKGYNCQEFDSMIAILITVCIFSLLSLSLGCGMYFKKPKVIRESNHSESLSLETCSGNKRYTELLTRNHREVESTGHVYEDITEYVYDYITETERYQNPGPSYDYPSSIAVSAVAGKRNTASLPRNQVEVEPTKNTSEYTTEYVNAKIAGKESIPSYSEEIYRNLSVADSAKEKDEGYVDMKGIQREKSSK